MVKRMSFPWSALNRIVVILALCLASDRPYKAYSTARIWLRARGLGGLVQPRWICSGRVGRELGLKYERGQSLIERGAPLTEAMDSSQGGE
jgi:hypothetical protein